MYKLNKLLTLLSILIFLTFTPSQAFSASPAVRSIDTMKISRDIARDKLHDPAFDAVITDHINKIAGMGVTHVAINTPYDDEFLPLLKRWVNAAREKQLKIWYRGNFSGWEGWFNYPDLTRTQHLMLLKRFLENNPDLFENGDIFTACMECENGDPKPPWQGDPTEFRKFMIEEYNAMNEIFAKQKVKVTTNFNSMNGALALRVYDKSTTKALGGVVGIDHYVSSPEKLIEDIKILSEMSNGKIVIGEVGVPIPEVHGTQTSPKEQAEWMATALGEIQNMPEVIGINYWTSWGGSTALWDKNGKSSEVAKVLKNFYTGKTKTIKLLTNDKPATYAKVEAFNAQVQPHDKGVYNIPYLYTGQKVEITTNDSTQEIVLTDKQENYIVHVDSNRKKSLWDTLFTWWLQPFSRKD